MSAAFTPGPWKTAPYGNAQREATVQVVTASGSSQVCGPANIADAQLIAAAPDLQEILQQFVNGVETRLIDSHADETLANITNRARKALAKARGEQVPA